MFFSFSENECIFSSLLSLFFFLIIHHDGDQVMETKLKALNVPFFVEEGKPDDVITDLISQLNVELLVCDFNPLREAVAAVDSVCARNSKVVIHQVSSH